MHSFPSVEPVHCSMSDLTVASWSAYRFLRRQVKWSGIPISLKNFPQFGVIHIAKIFRIINKAEVDVFLEFSCFCFDLADIADLISGSSAFSESSFYTWNFSVHILLKPSLKDFEHNLVSLGNEHNCMVVWTFFVTAFLWDWNENVSTAEFSKFAGILSAAL